MIICINIEWPCPLSWILDARDYVGLVLLIWLQIDITLSPSTEVNTAPCSIIERCFWPRSVSRDTEPGKPKTSMSQGIVYQVIMTSCRGVSFSSLTEVSFNFQYRSKRFRKPELLYMEP